MAPAVWQAAEAAGQSTSAPQTWHAPSKQAPPGQVVAEQLPALQVLVAGLQTEPIGHPPPQAGAVPTQLRVSGLQACPAGQPAVVQSAAGSDGFAEEQAVSAATEA